MTAKFNSRNEARQIAEALYASGRITAWSDYRSGSRFMVRIQLNGRWTNMLTTDAAQVA